jgi:hypothetical protein
MNLKKKCFIAFGLITLIISLFLSVIPSVSAQSGDSGERNPQLVIADLYAKHYGVSIDEALHRLKLQDSFPGLSTALENNEKDTYGGLWIQHAPDYKIIIAFTRDGEKTISGYTKYITTEVAPYIEIRTVNKSFVELKDDESKLLSSLEEQGIKVDSHEDIINNRISIDVTKTDEDKFNIARQNKQIAIPDGLKVNFVDSLMVLCTNIYGGLQLNYYSWGNPCSTSGFSVINSSGTKGITTAGHATYGSLYYGSTSLPFQGTVMGYGYDCQWRTCPGLTVTNKIQWWSDGSTFDITSKKTRSEQHVGDIISKYGITTHYTAGQISNLGMWIDVSNIFGYPRIADLGDSGGPVFSGNCALGTSIAIGDNYQTLYYMSQDYLESMGVAVNYASSKIERRIA